MCPSVLFEKKFFRKQKLDIFFRLSGKDCRPSDSKHFVCVLKIAFIVSKEFFEEKQIFDGNVFFLHMVHLEREARVFKASFCLSVRIFWGKKSLKKYSEVYFSWNKKKLGRLAKKFRWVLKRGWHVSGDSLWGNITFWSKMSRLLLMAHVEHSTSNFSGQSNGQVVGSAFIEVNIFSSLLLHFDILGEKSLNL